MPRRTTSLLAALLTTFALAVAADVVAAQTAHSVIYVVRHAERAEDGTNDPPISEAGQARAERIAAIFADAGLTHLHTTDYRRTRSTIAPTASASGLEPEVYDPSDLDAFAIHLRSTPGRHLVVGHSNTNAELVAALGGDDGGPIGEMEYDRGYVVIVRAGGATGSEIFRFGRPDAPER